MSKLETNTIDNISGSSTLNIGDTNATNITIDNGVTTLDFGTGISTVSNMPAAFKNTPAFEASLSAHQSIADNAVDKVQFNTEIFDTDNCYDNSTNYRFTPTVAGKYFVYARATVDDSAGQFRQAQTLLYKNGSSIAIAKANYDTSSTSEGEAGTPVVNTVVDMNGSTDYLEVFVSYDSNDGGTANIQGNASERMTNFGAYKLIGV